MPEATVNLDAAIDKVTESINRDLGQRIVTQESVTAALGKAVPHLLAASAAYVLRDMADRIDRGPSFPLPPSVISALIRERANDLAEEDATP